MNKVITLLEHELERQGILKATEEQIKKEHRIDISHRFFEDDLKKALEILKRVPEHDPRTHGYDTNYVEQHY